MKFFVQLDGKTAPVQVARHPKSEDLLSSFVRSNGATYTGSPNLFIGLKADKKGSHSAIAIKLNIQTPPVVILPKPIVVATPEPVVELAEEAEAKIEEVATPIAAPVTIVTQCCEETALDFRKFSFDFNFDQVNSGSRNEAWVTYANDKLVWIRQFGSEQLKLAHEMGCKCDSKYVVERALRDFSAFGIYEEHAFEEMDCPDTSFLLFLRNHAFSAAQKAVIKKFNGRVCLGWHYDNKEQDPADTEVIIQGFLGMCDLVCSFKDLLLHVEQSDPGV